MVEAGNIDEYNNLDLVVGLRDLEEMRARRATIATTAARYIIEECGGETTDIRLYYAAMFGRSYSEGMHENDTHLGNILNVTNTFRWAQEGEPLLVRHDHLPEYNASVGVVGSFSTEEFKPVKFEVFKQGDTEELGEETGYKSWQGHVAIAIRNVVPLPRKNGNEREYKLEEEPSKQTIGETHTIAEKFGLSVYPKMIGGIVTGENVHINSMHRGSLQDTYAFWLRNHLAPTEPAPFTPEHERTQEITRKIRQESAETQGIPEARAAAQSLSPTIAGFFWSMKPYTEIEGPVNVPELFQNWTDAYDAQRLLLNLQIHDLVEQREDGSIHMTKLGRAAMQYVYED